MFNDPSKIVLYNLVVKKHLLLLMLKNIENFFDRLQVKIKNITMYVFTVTFDQLMHPYR